MNLIKQNTIITDRITLLKSPKIEKKKSLLNEVRCNLTELTTSLAFAVSGTKICACASFPRAFGPQGIQVVSHCQLSSSIRVSSAGTLPRGCFPSPVPPFLSTGLPGFASHESGLHLGAGFQ